MAGQIGGTVTREHSIDEIFAKFFSEADEFLASESAEECSF